MTTVPWERLDPTTYENMVSVLISNLYPTSQRIDGSGGDGGRDVQVRSPDRLDLFELKYFADRLGSGRGRRRQVERSLERAAEHDPDSWSLVVPIDPTPSELDWFDGLREQYTFSLMWHGRTWLDAKMADYPQLARYFVEGAADEVIELVERLRDEQAALTGGAPDAIERMEAVRQQLNDGDPHYRYELSLGSAAARASTAPGAVMSWASQDARVDVFERYRGAAEDRPITFRVNVPVVQDGVDLTEQIREHVDFGRLLLHGPLEVSDVEIDAPVGLGGLFAQGRMTIGNTNAELTVPVNFQAAITDPTGTLVASLTLHMETRTRGRRGAVLEGHDTSRCLRATVRLDVETGMVNFSLRLDLPDEFLPSQALPAVRWLRAWRVPNRVQFRLPGTGERSGSAVPLSDAFPDDAELRLLEALHGIQESTGVYFPVPRHLSDEEAEAAVVAQRLLAGERVPFTWTTAHLEVEGNGDAAIHGSARALPGTELILSAQTTLTLAGHEVPLGLVHSRMDRAVLQEVADGDPTTLVFVPGETDTGERWLDGQPPTHAHR